MYRKEWDGDLTDSKFLSRTPNSYLDLYFSRKFKGWIYPGQYLQRKSWWGRAQNCNEKLKKKITGLKILNWPEANHLASHKRNPEFEVMQD